MSVQKQKYIILCLLLLVFCSPVVVLAQILDDSTKLVYGPETTQFITESDLLYNTDQIYFPDTSVNHFHRFSEQETRRYRYQNLGNLGTAMGPVYYQAPELIGERTGYYVYDHWFNGPEAIRYYNTKSPYTKLKYFLAGKGRAWIDVTHSRNVNPNWNVGFDFRRLSSDKQIGATRRRDDKQVVSTSYGFFTHYRTKDNRYQLMANFSRLKHGVFESGGIETALLPEDKAEIIDYENTEIRIRNAKSELYRINYHLYQQFQLNEMAQVYHRFDRQNQQNQFVHSPLKEDINYYHQVLISEDSTTERLNMSYWQNELGVKGTLEKLYYRLYYKRRDLKYIPKYLLPVQESEDYAGFNLRLAADSSLMVSTEGEYLVGGYYNAAAFMRLKWLEASIRRKKYKPAFIQEQYFGNHDEWYNDFTAPVNNELNAAVNLPFKRLQLRAGLRANVVQNHIYFTADSLTVDSRPVNVRPEQAGASAQILSPYAFVRWEFAPGFFLENELIYTSVSGKSANVFNMPEYLLNSSLYYEGEMSDGNLYAQVGVDAHWRSAYFANGYDPVTQQFLVQNSFEVPAYPVIDLFFSFRISRTRIFARMSHINQGFPADGYFTTPYYSGVKRTFDLGVNWLFFD